jgi:hypothetical protein
MAFLSGRLFSSQSSFLINQDEESTLDLVRRSCGREEQCTQESNDDSSDKKACTKIDIFVQPRAPLTFKHVVQLGAPLNSNIKGWRCAIEI